MKIIGIPVSNNKPSAQIDERFGRAKYIYIYNMDTNEGKFVENSATDAHGQGPKLIQLLASNSVEYIITQNLGGNAYEATRAAGITVFFPSGSGIQENLDAFRENRLTRMEKATKESH